MYLQVFVPAPYKNNNKIMQQARIQFHDLHPTADDLRADVIVGLSNSPRNIPPKYFYDQNGSRLFDEITNTEEYYPTRTETQILKQYAKKIAEHIGTGSLLVEPGGGSCAKVRLLLEGLRPCAYVPMDISKDHLWIAAEQTAAEFPWLEVHAACTDFTQTMALPDNMPSGTRVAFFPGSSIGNFDPEGAIAFLSTVAAMVQKGGYLLIGVDVKKDEDVLHRAYNDVSGITARFNLNLLKRINRELAANFELSAWRHRAFYNAELGRIEMHLRSTIQQVVQIDDHEFFFDRDETIHTENSYKYDVDEFQEVAKRAGFVPEQVWMDKNKLFSVHLFSVSTK